MAEQRVFRRTDQSTVLLYQGSGGSRISLYFGIFSKNYEIEKNLFRAVPTPHMIRHYKCDENGTGRERLIRSHSSARFCFELSGNSN